MHPLCVQAACGFQCGMEPALPRPPWMLCRDVEKTLNARAKEQELGPGAFIGLATVDVVYAVGSAPSENEKSIARRQEIFGGPAANAAIIYAFLRGSATLVSAVGSHPLAEVIRRELEHFWVSLQDLTPTSTEIPPVSSILVSERTGARTVISGHAARKQVPAEAVDLGVLRNAAVLLVDGHQMDCGIRAAAQAKAQAIPVVFDGGSWKDGADKLLAQTQIAICSEQFRPPGTTSPSEVVAYLLDHGPEAVAITRGASPIIWATHRQTGELVPPGTSAVDTLGAGDIFHGAFCHRLVSGALFSDALAFAAEVAAYSCRFFGSRSWMNTWSQHS
jgi:sugar/nucleoside kinase (ribokinase family)